MSVKSLLKPIIQVPLETMAARWGHHRRDSKEPRLWIMMYHRILPQNAAGYSTEEPGMIVEPETFRMHLNTLKSEFTMISLGEWINRKINNKPLPLKACAVTFDDGWLDNYDYAYPILKQLQIPATLFAVSDMLGTKQTFWPNRIQTILQQPIEKLTSISWLTDLLGHSPMDKELSSSVIYSLKHHSDQQLIQLIEQTESDLEIPTPKTPVLIDLKQIREMSDSGLIEIGSHTCQHIRLVKGLSKEVISKEIVNSKKQLEEILDKPIELFCYPNGDYCDAAVKEVASHYKAAVTTQKGINTCQSDLFSLSRIGVHQDVSNNQRRLLARVANWP